MSARVLHASELTETHPELPEGWRRDIYQLRAYGWPWNCETCNKPSNLPWKCSRCGRPWP